MQEVILMKRSANIVCLAVLILSGAGCSEPAPNESEASQIEGVNSESSSNPSQGTLNISVMISGNVGDKISRVLIANPPTTHLKLTIHCISDPKLFLS